LVLVNMRNPTRDGFKLNFKTPMVMGVLNLAPDSFYAGSRQKNSEQALITAKKMAIEGAGIIDVGGEPTNPFNQQKVSLQQELDRVIPVIEKLSSEIDLPISIDTSQPEVMHEAVKAGASLINDVRALRLPGAVEMAAKLNVPICLMHMRFLDQAQLGSDSSPLSMESIKLFLMERIAACTAQGIEQDKIFIDPGIGAGRFGKSLTENLQILRYLAQLKSLGCPILVGVSRKLFIGELIEAAPEDRLYASIAATTIAVYNGANIIRSHDVKPTVDAVRLAAATLEVV